MAARIEPAEAPFSGDMQTMLAGIMPEGVPPLVLFTTLARDERLFKKFFAGNLLEPGHLTLRQREIVIDRTTALCRSEYEWGVHVAFFGERAGFTKAQRFSMVHGDASDECWVEDDRRLMEFCDELHRTSSLSTQLWDRLRNHFSEEAMLELLLLAGFYRTVSYLTNALRLTPESFGTRFPQADSRDDA